MIAIPAGLPAQHGTSQQGFAPERDQTLRIEVLGVQRPEPHHGAPARARRTGAFMQSLGLTTSLPFRESLQKLSSVLSQLEAPIVFVRPGVRAKSRSIAPSSTNLPPRVPSGGDHVWPAGKQELRP